MTPPTVASEAWLDLLHRSRFPAHPVGCSCSDAWMDRAEAEDLERLASEAGWRLVHDLSLPDSVPAGDPKIAAASIDNLSDRQWAAWWLLTFAGPMTDEELADRYSAQTGGDQRPHLLPPQTPQSIRSRRAELVRAGHVVDTGEKRPTKAGGRGRVWAAVDAKAVAA